MKIAIGTENPTKIRALEETIQEYAILSPAVVISSKVDTGVSDQPMTLDQTMLGAQNRARAVYSGCDLSVGIESGFIEAPLANGGLMEVTVCAIYDGNQVHYGFSSGFNCPQDIMGFVKQGRNLNDAAYLAGYTSNPEVGKAEGIIGVLTRGRVTRKEYTKQAIRMALIHIENRVLK